MKPIIRVDNLSKQYTMGAKAEPYSTLRESLVSAVRKPVEMFRSKRSTKANLQFWALKDVSFDVVPGEVVGIIGLNGAGKSTLLKILSRITEPTAGRIELFGRVGSLLEVGTGFHPELTGRENIFLNGAILGMRQSEIARKFDEIVDFAEIEEFIDTPVKRYSSGMYVRLAFAVAAHLEPEVLIVDEVLAVGDTLFQKKCFGKIREIGQAGNTILIVSHDLRHLSALCQRAILLEAGHLSADGEIGTVVSQYLSDGREHSQGIFQVKSDVLFWKGIRRPDPGKELDHASPLYFEIEFESGEKDLEGLFVDIAIYNESGIPVIHSKSKYASSGFAVKGKESFAVAFNFDTPGLSPGYYAVEVYAYVGEDVLIWIKDVECCFVNSRNRMDGSDFIDGNFGATVPHFSVDIKSIT